MQTLKRLLFLLSAVTTAGHAEILLQPSTDTPLQGQPFELQIEVVQPRANDGGPALGSLQQDFQILSNRSNYLTEKRNGRTQFISRWTLMLSPRHSGQITIPPLNIKGEWSEPLTLRVQPKPAAAPAPVKLQVQLAQPQTYPHQPLGLNVQLWYSRDLSEAQITQPKIAGAQVAAIGEPSNLSRVVDGQSYQVVEQRYLIQAEASGSYQVPALQFQGSDAEGQPLNATSQPQTFQVTPYPDPNLAVTLAASEVGLQQQWQQPLDNLQAGDTLTRTLTLTAHGIPAQWLPDIPVPADPGVSVYPQPAKLQQQLINGVLVSQKQVDYKLLLTRAGTIELAPIELSWWDTVRQRAEVSQLPATQLEVVPFNPQSTTSPGQPAEPAKPSTQTSDTIPWQAWLWAAIALICAVGWALSAQRQRQLKQKLDRFRTEVERIAQQQSKRVSEDDELERRFLMLSRACQHNDPETAYRLLFDWARLHWPQTRIDTLDDIDALAKDPTLGYLLKNLDHQRRDPDDSWHGDLLLERLSRLRQKPRAATPGHRVQVTLED